MSTCKRKRTDTNSDEDHIGSLLSAREVFTIISSVRKKHEEFLTFLSTEKTVSNKEKLRTCIVDLCEAFNIVSSAYLGVLAGENVAKNLNESLSGIRASLENTNSAIAALANAKNENQATYASIANRNLTKNPSDNVNVSRGRSFAIPKAQRLIIGPTEATKTQYVNSSKTKEILERCVNPAELKIHINRVSYGPSSSVIVEGENLNPQVFRECEAFNTAGLEIKPDKN